MLKQELLKFERTEEGLFKIYDRFSFDELFRLLLTNGFEHEEALNFILCSCALSTLVFQERIYNNHYPDAELIRVVQDNLNTHTYGSFYQRFEPEEARQLCKKFESALLYS